MTIAAAALTTVSATALQVVKPAWLQGRLGPSCQRGLGAVLNRAVSYVDHLKTANPLALTMAHGVVLKAVAEILSQVIPQLSSATAWLDPLRLARSTIASVLSSSLSFYYWSQSSFVRGLTAPAFVRAIFGKGFGTSLTKMVVTQALYRPINVFLFLAMQSFFRGDSARQMVHVLRTKFKGGLVGGIAFFAVSNILMFSVPIPFLHPIIGASECCCDGHHGACHHPSKCSPPALTPLRLRCELCSCRLALQRVAGDGGLPEGPRGEPNRR